MPDTQLGDYLALATLLRAIPAGGSDEVLSCRGVLWEKFLRPLLVSVLNTAPEEASADLAGAVVRETLAKGGGSIRPAGRHAQPGRRLRRPGPARLRQAGAEVRFGRRLSALKLQDGRVSGLTFADGEEAAGSDERVILAMPPWTAQELLPDLTVPDAFCAIVNAHFKIAPPAGAPLSGGLVGGTAEWVFAFHDRLSVTVSGADRLVDMDTQELTARFGAMSPRSTISPARSPPCRIVKERRATFAATPAQDARRPACPTRWPNLFLAGDWTDTGLPATIEGALRSGETAAALAR